MSGKAKIVKETPVVATEIKAVPVVRERRRSIIGICFGFVFSMLFLALTTVVVILFYQYLLNNNSSTNVWNTYVRTPLKSKSGVLFEGPVTLEWIVPVYDQIFNKWLPQIITPKHHKQYVAPYLPNIAELSKNSVGHLKLTTQSIPYVALVVMILYIVWTRFMVLFLQVVRGNGRANNVAPRSQQAKMLEEGGAGARAIGNHENAIEALLYFSVSLFAALQTPNVDPVYVAQLCVVIVASRFVYHWLYVLDVFTGMTRTIFWYIGFVGNLHLLFVPLQYYKVF